MPSTILEELKDQVVLEFGKPTRSGKIYSKECIESALENPILKERLNNKCFFGELRSGLINKDEPIQTRGNLIAFNTENIYTEEDKLKVDIVILDTFAGNILTQVLKDPDSAFLGIRGTGNMDSNGVVSDLEIESIDYIFPNISLEDKNGRLEVCLNNLLEEEEN